MSPERSHRIALCGSAGTGKTTLGEALAARLDLPFLPEPMRARLEGGLNLHDYTIADTRRLMFELYDEANEAMTRAEREAGGYVLDRSPADFLAFWLYYRLMDDEAATEALLSRVREDLPRLDAILLLPWGGIPFVADGVRAPNVWLQLHFQALFEGLVARYVPHPKIFRVPDDLAALETRVAWALDCIGAGDD